MEDQKGVPKDDAIIDKNILREGDPILSKNKVSPILKSHEIRRLTSIFTLFSKVFLDYQKKEMLENKKSVAASAVKQVQPMPEKEEKKKGWLSLLSLLAGGVALVAGAIPMLVAAFFEKVGPLANILKAGGKTFFTAGWELIKRAFGKVFTGGLKFFKKLPYIGALVDFYFAYEEFKAGRIAAGIMEIIIGLSNFVPVVGPALSIGLDILKVFMDSKGMFDEGGAFSNENAWGTIKKWASDIGKKIWDNALWLPILGGIKRFGMAKDAFSSGNHGEGLKQILLGVLSFTGAAGLIHGFEVLAGFLNGRLSQPPKELNEDSSWADRLVEWIRTKLDVLPWFIKKPLAWFGIIPDEMAGEAPSSFTSITDGVKQGFEKTKQFIGGIWDKVKGPMGDSVETVRSFAVETWEKTKEFSANAWETTKEKTTMIWNSIKETSTLAWEGMKIISNSFRESIQNMTSKVKNVVSSWVPGVIDTIKGLADSAKELVKTVARTIGKWIAGLFSDDEKAEIEQRQKNQEAVQKVAANNTQIVKIYFENQTKFIQLLQDSSKKQIALLTELVSVEKMALTQLKNMSGKSSGGGSMNMSFPMPQSNKALVPVGDNRNGYMSSPYALS